jgi:hypothetical protein
VLEGDEKYKILIFNPQEKRYLGDVGVGGKIILKWIFKLYGVRVWTEFGFLKIKSSGGPL